MLLGAIRILVVLAAGDPGDASSRAVERALHAALARDATVAVRLAPRTAPSEEEVAALGAQAHADVVCIVTWTDHQRRVALRFSPLPETHWTARELVFDGADAPGERGRTVGFALASMMPDEAAAREAAEATPEPAAPRVIVTEPPASSGMAAEQPRAPLPRENPLAIDAVALAVTAPEGFGGGIGGAFGVRIPLTGALGFHGGLNARAGSIRPAAVSSRIIGAAAGLAWQPWLDAQHRWAAGVRADAALVFIDLEHLDADDTEGKHLYRLLPGASALVEGTYRFADQASLVAAAGTEVSFGNTDLFLADREVASMPAAKLTAELGLRVSFR